MQTATEQWLRGLLANGDAHAFYTSRAWVRLRRAVLREQNNECQLCKAKGRYRAADTVHHVHYVKARPDLALSRYDEQGERNLLAVCRDCHHALHESDAHDAHGQRWRNEERW